MMSCKKLLLCLALILFGHPAGPALAQTSEVLPWERPKGQVPTYGADRGFDGTYGGRRQANQSRDYGSGSNGDEYGEPYRSPVTPVKPSYERREPFDPRYGRGAYEPPRGSAPPPRYERHERHSGYSQNEILRAGHSFFGSVSKGLASVVEYAFKRSGRPNGYILGEDASAAYVVGARYGEGVLYTKDAGSRRVFWQGPSVGVDFGADGSKTMILVYNLRHPSDIYARFAGVQGSAYLIGGASIQFQSRDDREVVMAPIRSGVGFRLGANIGYLKYTRRPTWNPF